ncbi:MAG TPA: hypothetical protein DDW80_08770 [Desulfovibrio sp.]|nr:hypothetical protein [Desulfovibrio sp.]
MTHNKRNFGVLFKTLVVAGCAAMCLGVFGGVAEASFWGWGGGVLGGSGTSLGLSPASVAARTVADAVNVAASRAGGIGQASLGQVGGVQGGSTSGSGSMGGSGSGSGNGGSGGTSAPGGGDGVD